MTIFIPNWLLAVLYSIAVLLYTVVIVKTLIRSLGKQKTLGDEFILIAVIVGILLLILMPYAGYMLGG